MPTVFITGATRNTGLAIAEKFAQNGYDIALSSRNLEQSRDTAAMLEKKYAIKAVFCSIEEDFGGLDTFVANSANLGVYEGGIWSGELL